MNPYPHNSIYMVKTFQFILTHRCLSYSWNTSPTISISKSRKKSQTSQKCLWWRCVPLWLIFPGAAYALVLRGTIRVYCLNASYSIDEHLSVVKTWLLILRGKCYDLIVLCSDSQMKASLLCSNRPLSEVNLLAHQLPQKTQDSLVQSSPRPCIGSPFTPTHPPSAHFKCTSLHLKIVLSIDKSLILASLVVYGEWVYQTIVSACHLFLRISSLYRQQ